MSAHMQRQSLRNLASRFCTTSTRAKLTQPRARRLADANDKRATTAAAVPTKPSPRRAHSEDHHTATANEEEVVSMIAKNGAAAAIAAMKRYEEEVGVKIKDIKCGSFFSMLAKDADLTIVNSKRLDGAGVDVASLACDSFFSRIRDNTFVVVVIFLSSEFSSKTLKRCINRSPLIKHVEKMAELIKEDERKVREFSSRIGSRYCESAMRLAAELSEEV